ncbi:MAG: pyruvate formate lyase-activating protein [Candidatus Lokiarchaeota archaeon]|nr:pyruvate formate lyase-activating protein [Candidatus Lokiarchaeota archaeon]
MRPDSSSILNDSVAQNYLNRYYELLKEKKIANYLIMKKLEVDLGKDDSFSNLWNVHNQKQEEFKALRKNIDKNKQKFEDLEVAAYSFLDLKIDIARLILSNCHFCERNCNVNRISGELGYCRIGPNPYISSAHLHYGEESPLVPSGTIFFSGCTFSCVFCQNFDISSDPRNGIEIDSIKLAHYANHLKREENARNINYVSPLAHSASIIESLKYQTQNVAQLWNSNHYCSVDTINLINDIIDFWLPDFKYGNDKCALKYSNAKDYFSILTRNLKMNYDHFDAHQSKNTIIRILILPNHVECCVIPILNWIKNNTPKVLINIMGQYRPTYKVPKNELYKEISRYPSSGEMDQVREYADELKLAWRQVS